MFAYLAFVLLDEHVYIATCHARDLRSAPNNLYPAKGVTRSRPWHCPQGSASYLPVPDPDSPSIGSPSSSWFRFAIIARGFPVLEPFARLDLSHCLGSLRRVLGCRGQPFCSRTPFQIAHVWIYLANHTNANLPCFLSPIPCQRIPEPVPRFTP